MDFLYVRSTANDSGGLNVRSRQYVRVLHDKATNKLLLALGVGSDLILEVIRRTSHDAN